MRDFNRNFGGLWAESNLGHSIQHYFLNGGTEAFVIRLYKASAENSTPVKTPITLMDFHFEAINEGSWGENLRVKIDFNVSSGIAKINNLNIEKMFNLIITETEIRNGRKINTNTESYKGLTIEDHPGRVDRILENQSKLLRYRADKKLPVDLVEARGHAINGVLVDNVSEAENNINNKLVDNPKADVSKEKEELIKALESIKTSDGQNLDADEFVGEGKEENGEGIYALEDITPYVFNLMCIPPYNGNDVDPEVITKAAEYCEKKRAFLLVDPPSSWQNENDAVNGLSTIGTDSANAAIYFPRVKGPDPINNYVEKEFAPSGAIAGIIARTDTTQGVWKAPAGVEAVLQGVEVSMRLTDDQNGQLNPLGINSIRNFPLYGNIVWGSRTLQGSDQLQSEWKYVPVRRLSLFLEESINRSTNWAVFEPNAEPLWAGLRNQIEPFMMALFREGAFQGETPSDAFFVKVDSETTTQNDIDNGVVNILVGFAPTKPAEFVIFRIGQKTADNQS